MSARVGRNSASVFRLPRFSARNLPRQADTLSSERGQVLFLAETLPTTFRDSAVEAVEKLRRSTVKPKNQRKVLTRTASMVSRHLRKAFQATLASVLRRLAEDRGVFLHPRW